MRGARTLFIGLIVLVVAASPALAAGGALNYDSGNAPNPYYDGDVTIAAYDVGWGDSLQYYDDSANVQQFPGNVNSSTEVDDLGTGHVNPYSFTATDIDNDDVFGQFPRKSGEDGDNSASALDASEWSSTTSDSSNVSPAVSDVTTAEGVQAVEVATSGGMGSGDTATFTYSNFSITSDVSKRVLAAAVDVDTLDSATVVEVRAVDSDGDYVEVTIDTAKNEANAGILANATGEGDVSQQKVGDLTVAGSGDGTMSEIQKIEVQFADGDANVDFALLELEKTSKLDFGQEYTNTDTSDGDDDLETNTVYEPHGSYSINSIDTLGPAFSNATIKGLTVPFRSYASQQADDDVSASFSAADSYPAFDQTLDQTVRMELPTGFDLSYANLDLKHDQKWASSRFAVYEYAEAVGDDTAFSDISDSSYTDKSGSLGGTDNTVTIDSTINPGDDNVVHLVLKLTSEEAQAMRADQSASSSGGGGIFGGGGGGLVGFLTSIPGIIVGGLTALGIGRFSGVF